MSKLTVQHGAECARVVPSNSPVTDVGGDDIRCNANTSPASSNCAVSAGDVVTVEMHQVSRHLFCNSQEHMGRLSAHSP